MVLSLEQPEFIVKWNYETHSLERVYDNFIQEFPNSVSLFNHNMLNLIKKFEYKHTPNDVPHLGQPSMGTSEKRVVMAKNVMERTTTSS